MEPKEHTEEQNERRPHQETQTPVAENTLDQATERQSGAINKYFILIGILGLLVVGGIVYRVLFVSDDAKPIETGIEKSLSIVTRENTWSFEPEIIEVDQGDRVILTITNEDEYDHGFAIDAFGISQRMPAKGTIRVEFVVTKAGTFPYYCSVSCGSGIVDGEERGHFDQIGKLHVRSLVDDISGGEMLSDEALKAETKKRAMLQQASQELSVPIERVQFDDGNVRWLEAGRSLEVLEGTDYQALYYQPEDYQKGKDWVFIDTVTGEIIDQVVDE